MQYTACGPRHELHCHAHHFCGPAIQERHFGVRRISMLYLLWVVLIGILAGWLAGQITKGRGFGLLGDLIVGILGSLLGSFIFGLLGIAAYGLLGRLVMAVVGAMVLLWLIRLIKRA
jgi:uncharacterized membrane protein YeaQ/YmgE (transglycosylase-associated protein family)